MPDVADGPQTYVRRLDDVDAAVPITVRRYDLGGELLHPHRRPDGTLLCEGRSVREGVLEYRRADGSIHRELVTRQALIDTATSGARATMTLDHPSEGFVSPDYVQRLMTGDVDGTPSVEEDAQGGFVRVRVALRRRDAIDAFDSGKARQLSWGYEATLDETPGEHPVFGRYDASQIGRVVNHLAQVERGRSAGAVLRADSADAASSGCWAHLPKGTFHDDEETIMKPGLVAMLTMLGVSRFDNEDAAISEGHAILRRRKDEEEAEAAAEPAKDMVDPAEHEKLVAAHAALVAEHEKLKGENAAVMAEKAKTEEADAAKRDAAELTELQAIAGKVGVKADGLTLPKLRIALAKTRVDSIDDKSTAEFVSGVLGVVRADAAKKTDAVNRWAPVRGDSAADGQPDRWRNPTLDAIDAAKQSAAGGAK